MAYATAADLETRFGAIELEQLASRDGTEDPAIVAAALADAAHEIDGYLGAVYQLPLISVPPLLQRLACDIARYRLWRDGHSDIVRQNYQDAVDALRDIAKGKIRLQIEGIEPDQPALATPGSRVSVFTSATFDLMP